MIEEMGNDHMIRGLKIHAIGIESLSGLEMEIPQRFLNK